MIVSRDNFHEVLERLTKKTHLALDTETTGLRPYHGDRVFSVIIADEEKEYYFNYALREDIPESFKLTDYVFGPILGLSYSLTSLLNLPLITWFLHNAKFDLAHLEQTFGWTIRGRVLDTKTLARLIENDRLSYSLDSLAQDIGQEKDKTVEEYIDEHGLWDWESVPGKDRRVKLKHYDQVPFAIIVPYAERDARLTFQLGVHYLSKLSTLDETPLRHARLGAVLENEIKLTKTIYAMERLGVKIDEDFCTRAAAYEQGRMISLVKEFEEKAGVPFKNSSKVFAEIFKAEKVSLTKKGNPCFDSDALAKLSHPLARLVLQWRDAKSRSDFYHGFLYHADAQGVIHTNLNQDGTLTGRFSSSSPNLQNLTKPEDDKELKEEFVIRRAFIPRDGFFFAMLDYDQMEYRLMLDMAEATELVQKVLGGLDVHQATADLAGISRTQAKTANFAILYGSGALNLAEKLGISLAEAKRIKQAIFEAAPRVEGFIHRAMKVAGERGYVANWLGRRYAYPDLRFTYRAPNALIQGGGAETLKMAMNSIRGLFCDRRLESRMVLTIHDELILEMSYSEKKWLGEVKKIMESAYPHRVLPLTVSVSHSYKSLADKIVGFPT